MNKIFVVLWIKKILKQRWVICCNFSCFKNKKEKLEIILMYPQENLVNSEPHAFGLIETYFLFNLLIKLV